MKSAKIMENLFIGDLESIPDEAQLVICCDEEIFYKTKLENNIDLSNSKNPDLFWLRPEWVFVKCPAITNDGIVDPDLVVRILKIISDHISNKAIYICSSDRANQCACIAFIYLVLKGFISSSNLEDGLDFFNVIYPAFSPYQEWADFLYDYYPYETLNIN